MAKPPCSRRNWAWRRDIRLSASVRSQSFRRPMTNGLRLTGICKHSPEGGSTSSDKGGSDSPESASWDAAIALTGRR